MGIRKVVQLGTAVCAVLATVLIGASPGQAATPVSQSSAHLLHGDIAGQDLASLIALPGVVAENFGGPTVTKSGSPDVSLVNGALNVPLGDVLGLAQAEGLSLGLLKQLAEARNSGASNGEASAASLGVDLAGITGGNLSYFLEDLEIGFGAVQAHAEQTAGESGAQTGGCEVAGLTLRLRSYALYGPLYDLFLSVDNLAKNLQNALKELDFGIEALTDVQVNGLDALDDLAADMLKYDVAQGGLVLDVQNGVLDIDVAKLLGAADLNLCALGPDTDVMPAVIEAITQRLPEVIKEVISGVIDKITSAAGGISITMTVDGKPYELSVAQLQVVTDLVDQTINPVVDNYLKLTLDSIAGIVAPVAQLLGEVVGITVNHQSSSNGFLTVTALRLTLGAPPVEPQRVAGRVAPFVGEPPEIPDLGVAVELNVSTAAVGPGVPLDEPPPDRPDRPDRPDIIIDAGRGEPRRDTDPVTLILVGLVFLGAAYLITTRGREGGDS